MTATVRMAKLSYKAQSCGIFPFDLIDCAPARDTSQDTHALPPISTTFAVNLSIFHRQNPAFHCFFGVLQPGGQPLCQIDSFAYFRDVLERISIHPASRIAELLPRNSKPSCP